MYHATNSAALPNAIPEWAIKITAIFAVIIITLINIASARFGARANLLFTVLKVPNFFSNELIETALLIITATPRLLHL
jgi:hypothetical protein